MKGRVFVLVATLSLLAPLSGCSNACDELADEVEECCSEEEDAVSEDFCLAVAEAIREQGDSGECQKALDEGEVCSAQSSSSSP